VGSEDVVGLVVHVDVVVPSNQKRIRSVIVGALKIRFHACLISLIVFSLSYVLCRSDSWLLCNVVVFQLQDPVFCFFLANDFGV